MNRNRRALQCAAFCALLFPFVSGWLPGCAVYDSSLTVQKLETTAGDTNRVGALAGNTNQAGNEITTLAGSSMSSAGVGGDAPSAGGVGGSVGVGASASTADGGSGGVASGLGGIGGIGGIGGARAGSTGGGAAGVGAAGGPGGSGGKSGIGSAGTVGNAGGAGASAGAGGAAPAIVELALAKKSTCSSSETGNESTKGNDGSVTTKFCAADGTFPQWWRVDLGAVHPLKHFAITFEQPDRQYTYKIETSPNDSVYTLQASLSGTGTNQGDNFPSGLGARYVRITITNATPGVYSNGTYPTWACFFEFSVLGS